MIISISGLIGSGKDTIAEFLEKEFQFHRESWAGTLKDAVSFVFGWDRELLEGKTSASREWREQKDIWWSDRLNQEIVPRRILQYWGTEVCRQNFHDEIWVASLENKLRTTKKNVVISDTRFSNEIECVKRLNGINIRVRRGKDPLWVDEYLRYGSTSDFLMKYPDIHASEYSSLDCKFDYIVENDGTIEDLHLKINNLVQYLLSSR